MWQSFEMILKQRKIHQYKIKTNGNFEEKHWKINLKKIIKKHFQGWEKKIKRILKFQGSKRKVKKNLPKADKTKQPKNFFSSKLFQQNETNKSPK